MDHPRECPGARDLEPAPKATKNRLRDSPQRRTIVWPYVRSKLQTSPNCSLRGYHNYFMATSIRNDLQSERGVEVGLGGLRIRSRSSSNDDEAILKTCCVRCLSPGRSAKLHDELIPLGVLGHGACSKVYKVLHVPSLRILAQKVVPIFDEQKRRQIVQELHVLHNSCSARHRIVNFYDAFIDPGEGSISILVEYMDGGSLQDVVDSGGCAHETVLANMAWRILSGLVHLHDTQRQVHRDIKPANLLINHHGDVKISDFGITRRCAPAFIQNPKKNSDGMTFVGTVSYMSPERLLGETYDFKADIWSLGVTLVTCALGHFPYSSKFGFWGLLQALRKGPPPKLPSEEFSRLSRDFVEQCVRRAPELRPSASDLLRHPFMAPCMRAPVTAGVITSPNDIQLEIRELVSAASSHHQAARDNAVHLSPDELNLIRLAYQFGAPHALVQHEFTQQQLGADMRTPRELRHENPP